MEFKENFKLKVEDIDKNNEITNKAILSILENIGEHQSDELGYGIKDIEKNRSTWVYTCWNSIWLLYW